MPLSPSSISFNRIWKFVDRFRAGDEVERQELDIALDDLTAGLNAALQGGFFAVGDWAATSGAFPTARPDASAIRARDAWYVTAAGAVDGISFAIGDYLIATHAGGGLTYAGNWHKTSATVSQMLGLTNRAETAAEAAEAAQLAAETAQEAAEDAALILESVAYPVPVNIPTVANQQDYAMRYDPGRSDRVWVFLNGKYLLPNLEYIVVQVAGTPTLRLLVPVNHANQTVSYIGTRVLSYDPNLNRVEGFHSRADLVAHIAANGAVVGQTYIAGGLSYIGSTGATAIADLPGLLPVGDWTFGHWGAVGDNVADDAPQINAAMAAFRAELVARGNQSSTLAMSGEGKTYRANSPIDMTKLQTWGWEVRSATIHSHATGLVAVEQVGSRGGTYRNLVVYGNKTNRPAVGIYTARALAGGGLAFCDNCIYEDVQTIGYYSVAGGVHYGQEETIYNRCGWWNYDQNGVAAYLAGNDAAFPPVTLTHEAPITGATSSINNQYNICSWRYLPIGRAFVPTAITKGASTVITATAIPSDFAVGQSVTFFLIGGMSQINNLVGEITAITATTMTVDINSSAFSNFTSGGNVVGTQASPSLVFGRASGHNFAECYIVAYGAPNVRHVFPDTSIPAQNTFNMLFEGSGSPTHFEFDGGATARTVLDYTFRTYNTHSRDSVIDTTGGIVWRNGELTASNLSRGAPDLLGTPADFTFHAVDIAAPTAAGFSAAATGGHTGRLYYFDTDQLSEKALLRSTGSVDAEVNGSTAQFRAVSLGTVEGYLNLDSATNGWLLSGNGSTTDYVFAAGGFYPSTDSAYSLGLANRRWSTISGVNVQFHGVLSYPEGYALGASVTQLTSKTTAVTINKKAGDIVTAASALAGGAVAVFEVNNSTVAPTDMPYVVVNSVSNSYSVRVMTVSSGRFSVEIKNETAGSLSDAVTIGFVLGVRRAIT